MSVSSLPSGCSPTVQPVVAGLDGTDADLREFIDLKVGNILQRLEGQEKLLESISLRFEKVEPETWKAQPRAGRWSGSRRPSVTMASASALDVVPISARNSNPSSTHGGALHFAPRMRQSRDDLRRKGSMASIGEEFASYSRTDARKMNAARDHGQRQMATAVERRKEPEVQVRRSRSSTIRWFQAMVTHPAFDVFFAALVGLNTIFMGIDAELQLADQVEQGESVALSVTRRIFTAAFTVELVLRIVAHGRDFFCKVNFWNWLDTVIVVAGLAEVTFDVIQAAAGGASVPSMVSLRALRILRITRMLKIIRVLRIFRFVLALRTLVQSTIHTLKSLFWALVLLGLIVYVFALVFTEVTGDMIRDLRVDGDQQSASLKYFGSVTTTMLSLFMSIAGGVSWEDVLEPLRQVSEIWVVLFIMYVSFTYFAVLNVVTAVFCQSAIESAQNDHSTKCQAILADKEMHIEKIKGLFQEIDEEHTGIITYETFQQKMHTPEVRTYFETIDLDVWDAWSFFKLLDLDEGGSVEIEEFLMGCLRLRGSARSMDVAKLMYDQAWLIKNQGQFWAFVEERLRMLLKEVSSSNAKCSDVADVAYRQLL